VLGFGAGESVCLVDTSSLDVIERLRGWYGRYFHSPSMTSRTTASRAGASIHEHFHPQKEVYEVVEGELEVTIDGAVQTVRGMHVRDRSPDLEASRGSVGEPSTARNH
jgi:hypothetical protein